MVAHNGMLYVIGGDDGSSNLGSVEYYNPKLDTWTMLTTSMATGRSYAGVCTIDKPLCTPQSYSSHSSMDTDSGAIAMKQEPSA